MSSWAGTAEAYRGSFATLCAGTIPELLAATHRRAPGPHLDVGCGTGELARAAAAEGRRVIALDPDPGMVALTRAAGAPGPGELTVQRAGAPGLPVADGSAGAVTGNFVVNHVPDPRASVRDLARVAAPGAPIALTVWPATPGPHLAAVARAAEDCAAEPVPSTRLDPALDFPRSVDGLAGLVRECGLEVTLAQELRWTWRVSVPALLAGIRAGIAGPGRLYTAQTPPTRARLEQRIPELWSEHAEGEELAFPATAVLVVAAHG